MRVVIFGGRGGGQVVAESIKRLQSSGSAHELLGFLDDNVPAGSHDLGAPVLGPFAAWVDLPADVRFIAPLHKAKEMTRRALRIRGLEIPEQRWVSIIDPRACVASTVTLGHGVHVDALATLQPGVRLGAHVAVRGGAVVAHDVVMGDLCFVGANASIAGYARIEEGVHVALNACVREYVCVGRYAVIGLGSVVIRDVPAGAIVAGNPAREVGTVETYGAPVDISR